MRIKDPYEILINHLSKNLRLGVRVFLKNKIILAGFMIDSIIENGEIKAWQFVSNNNAIEYPKTGPIFVDYYRLYH